MSELILPPPEGASPEWAADEAEKATMQREMSEFADWMGESRLIFTRGQAMAHMDAMLDRYMARFGYDVIGGQDE